jgi:hypothetical protein
MALFVDSVTVTHGIQLAVAPVFLLTAVSGLISAVAGRLSRIIDRGRVLEEKLRLRTEPDRVPVWREEIILLRRRGRIANSAIGLLTACAFMIGLTIVVLFLGETTVLQADRLAIYGFLGSVLCFMSALGCFFAETMLATRILKFGLEDSD